MNIIHEGAVHFSFRKLPARAVHVLELRRFTPNVRKRPARKAERWMIAESVYETADASRGDGSGRAGHCDLRGGGFLVEVIGGALCVGGCCKNRAIIISQYLKPRRDI